MYFERPDALAAGFVMLPCRADALLLGVMGAYVSRLSGFREILLRNVVRVHAIFLLLLAGVAGLAFYSPNFMSPAMNWWGRSWLALFFLFFISITVVDTSGILSRITRSTLLRNLGSISYGVYLIHQVVFSLTLALIFPGAAGAASRLASASLVAFVLTLGLAFISYQSFEKPIVRLGHRLKY